MPECSRVLSSNEHTVANACITSHVAERRREHLKHRRVLRYRIPEDLVAHFDQYVPEYLWDNGVIDNPHAFMAELREIANDKVRNLVRGRKVYCFGGRPEVDLVPREGRGPISYSCVHICSKHGPKDTIRYRRAAEALKRRHFHDPRLAESLVAASSGARRFEGTTWMCFQGGEVCDVRIKDVDTAIAFDATYDVTPADFVRYMRRKGIVEAYITMVQPDNLFIDAKVAAPGVTWTWREQRGVVYIEQTFANNNSGEKYIHRRDVWCSWFTQSTITASEGTYDFKVIDRVGPYVVFSVTLQCVPVFREDNIVLDFNGAVAVPRADEIARIITASKIKGCQEDLAACMELTGMYLISGRVYRDFANWITTQERVEYRQALNYWRAISKGLMFGKTQVMERFDAGLPDKMFASVLLSTMAMRWRLSETINVVVDDMRERQHYGLYIEAKDYGRIRPRAKYRHGGRGWFKWRWECVSHLWDHIMHLVGCFGLYTDIEEENRKMVTNRIGGLYCSAIESVTMPLGHDLLDECYPRLRSIDQASWHDSIPSTTPLSETETALRAREEHYLNSLSRHASTSKAELRSVLTQAHTTFCANRELPHKTKPVLYIGPAGAGKTRRMLTTCAGKCLFIAASRVLAVDVKERAERLSRASWTVSTQHRAIAELATKNFDHVVLDEVYTYHAGYVLLLSRLCRDARLHLLGDPNQCGYYDEDEPAAQDGFECIANRYETLATTESHRVPQDIVALVNTIPGVHITSTNEKRGDVQITSYTQASALVSLKVDAVLTFSRQQRDFLATEKRLNVMTVREAQGMTFRDVAIVVDLLPKTVALQKMYYVAYTRATDRIVTVVNRTANSTLLNLGICGLNQAFSSFYGFVPYENSVHEDKELKLMTLRDDYTETITTWTEHDLCEAMAAALGPAPDMNPRALAVVPNQLIWDVSKTFKLSAAGVVPMDVSFTGYSYEGPKWTKAMWGKSVLQTLDTIVQRQGALVGEVPSDARKFIDVTVTDIADAFVRRYIRTGADGSPAFAPIDHEHLSRELSNYLQRCDEVGNIHLIEPLDLTNPQHATVQANMKRITKIVTGGPSATKAGQVISAWSKALTAIMAPITRAIERCLVDSLNSTTYYANVVPEKDLGTIYSLVCKGGVGVQSLNMDFSQFDASQSEVTIAIERAILQRMGAETELLDLYYALRSKWSAVCHGLCVVDAESMKSSGEPGTLLFNTILNMAYCAYITDCQDVSFMAFKGDDSCIVASKVDVNAVRAEMLEKTTRVTIKQERGEDGINHFCGAFLTPRGVIPDLVRTAAKIRGLVYRDEEHFKEYQLAVRDRLALLEGVTTGYSLLVHDQYYGISRKTGSAVVQDVFGFVNEFVQIQWGVFKLRCRESDARTGGADILVANCRSEVPILPPYDTAAIRRLYWEQRHDLEACDCGAGTRDLDLPCNSPTRNCLVCGFKGQRTHLCRRCSRTYRRDLTGKCGKHACVSAAVFADGEVLCLDHFIKRYKRCKGKRSNTYSIRSGSVRSAPVPSAGHQIHHTYSVVRGDIRVPKVVAAESSRDGSQIGDSCTETPTSSCKKAALVSASNFLDCGLVCVAAQLSDQKAKEVRVRVTQKRIDRAIATGSEESRYVSEQDLHSALVESGVGYLSVVQIDGSEDVGEVEAFEDAQVVVRMDFSPEAETEQQKQLREDYHRRLDEIMEARTAGRITEAEKQDRMRALEDLNAAVIASQMARRSRGHWWPKPRFKIEDPYGYLPEGSPHWGVKA